MSDIPYQDPSERVTLESIWTLFRKSERETRKLEETVEKIGLRMEASKMEVDQKFKETAQKMEASKMEVDQKIKETAQQLKETDEQLKETAQQLKETDEQLKETDRKLEASKMEVDQKIKETARQLKETDEQLKAFTKEAERRMKETDRQIGKLGHRFGELIEHLIAPNLLEKFAALGYSFTRTSRNNELKDHERKRVAQIDWFLENGQYALAIEVKSLCTVQDVKEHVKRMAVLRGYLDERGDTRKCIGAAAAALYDAGAKEQAVKSGLYVIQQLGDNVEIFCPPEPWMPHYW